jgi:hypothetical protein
MTTWITLANLRRGYARILEEVLEEGDLISARDIDARELTGVQLEFIDPLAPLLPIGVERRVNLRLAAVEALQVIGGESRSTLIQRAAPTFTDVLVDPLNLDYGAYGPRLAYAIGDCLDLLREDPDTRQAVASIWKPTDLEHAGDKPCTVFLQFLIRRDVNGDGERVLELYVYMRSQDAWLGVPYDVFTFSQLQHTMARALKLPAGRYVHNVTSLHLYERDVEGARRVVSYVRDNEFKPEFQRDYDLPLGVVSVGEESGFEVASYLLDDADETTTGSASDDERIANRWYADQMRHLLTTQVAT